MQGKKDYQEKLFAHFQLVIAYNLKKYLKFMGKRTKSGVGLLALVAFVKSAFQYLNRTFLWHLKFIFNF
ncbi:hypothetical protein [Maribacter luteus]|uniref:hypothetical protein n=1 Tax=Maribacter luteus TaxID=2594478 RepID=UPI002491C958|nr:hypothetical protein [Maribacter luteus]